MSDVDSVRRVTELPRLRPREPDSHKGTYGRVLVLAGSRGMAGAACLVGKAALRGGAGLVRVITTQSAWLAVASYEPSYLTWPLPEDRAGSIATAALPEVLDFANANDVIAVGPGLGQSRDIGQIIAALITTVQKPMVLDADAIHAVRDQLPDVAKMSRPAVLTPHPGEFARLTGSSVPQVQAGRSECAVRFARDHHVVLVLKGHGTVVTDGERIYINPTGNPGMATGGSGDVLTGLLSALIAQGMTSFDAAVLGVYVHGLAGDLAARELGKVSLIASDLLDYLPDALRTVEKN